VGELSRQGLRLAQRASAERSVQLADAGSIFTFSLSLGDYIAVGIVGGKTQLLANVIYGQLVTANNPPVAAALATMPLIAIVVYLLLMRRTGALENV
jgi:putative spermidine/putrescine transport system permease protein